MASEKVDGPIKPPDEKPLFITDLRILISLISQVRPPGRTNTTGIWKNACDRLALGILPQRLADNR
jgi:hypothetical protein